MPVLRLEQATVHALPYVGKAVNHQCIYWDETFACFGLRIYPSGRRAYVCSYRIHRRKRLAVLGRVDVLTVDQARRIALFLSRQSSRERRSAR